MTVAIETRIIPVTDHKPTRIVASTPNGQRIVMSKSAAEQKAVDLGLARPESDEAAHRAVAQTLANNMQWPGTLHCGATKAGYVFVFAEDQS